MFSLIDTAEGTSQGWEKEAAHTGLRLQWQGGCSTQGGGVRPGATAGLPLPIRGKAPRRVGRETRAGLGFR